MIEDKSIYGISPSPFAFWAVIRARIPGRGKKQNKTQKYYLPPKMPAKFWEQNTFLLITAREKRVVELLAT